MKETYEPMKMEIRELPEEDVITVSGIDEVAHDNLFIDWSMFLD